MRFLDTKEGWFVLQLEGCLQGAPVTPWQLRRVFLHIYWLIAAHAYNLRTQVKLWL